MRGFSPIHRGRAAGVLLAGAAFLAAACSRHSEPAVPEPGGTLQVLVFEPLDLLSPLYCTRPLTSQLLEQLTPPLGRIDEQGRIHLQLATRSVDNGAWIDYTLRRARWEDGTPVTARDLVLSATLLGDPRVKSPARAQVELLRAAEARDDSTLRLAYLVPYSHRRRDSLLFPLPAHRLPADLGAESLRRASFTVRPLACGPFRIGGSADEYRLTLLRNPNSGFVPARLDTVSIAVSEPEAAVAAFRRRTADVLVDLPVDRVEAVRAPRHGVRVVALVGTSYLCVTWNLRDARCSDPVVRRAAAQAVDVQRMVAELALGQGDPARGPLTALFGFADTTAVLRHDPQAAARALEAAGWRLGRDGVRERGGLQLAFHLLAPLEDPLRVAAARAVGGDLRRVGIDVEVVPLPNPMLLQRLAARQFEAAMGVWYPRPDIDLDPVWRSDATDQLNFGGYANPRVDSLLTRMRHELGEEDRERLLASFQAQVYADQPMLFLFQNPHFVVFGPRVRGAQPTVASPFWNLPEWWVPRRLRTRPAP